ncbi:MAG: hypothetical protein Q4D62_15950, partial [Planctomycetia bacterium]|nr:hypothetical protein [Planctomycetia bacterium]
MWGFKDKSTAERLKQLASSLKPIGKESMAFPDVRQPSLRTYIASPVGRIPGARRVFTVDSDNHLTWRLELGKGDVVIHQRDTDTSHDSFRTKARRYATQRDPKTRINPVIRTAFNVCPVDIEGNGTGTDIGCPDIILFCAEDFQGDLYIVSACPFQCESSSSSTSSTSDEYDEYDEDENECQAPEDVTVVTRVALSGPSLTIDGATLHFVDGKYCGATRKGCGNFDLDSGTEGYDEYPDDEYEKEEGGNDNLTVTINLCNIICPPPTDEGSSSEGNDPYCP